MSIEEMKERRYFMKALSIIRIIFWIILAIGIILGLVFQSENVGIYAPMVFFSLLGLIITAVIYRGGRAIKNAQEVLKKK
jgi:4-hydroxybenzoate polyprenyltransferase